MKFLREIATVVVACLWATTMAQNFYICTGADTQVASTLHFTTAGASINGMSTASVDSITPTVPQGQRFVGGDISLLPKYESQGAQYKDRNGQAVTDVIGFLKEQGWNTLRVRLFVDPTRSDDPKQCVQDLDYVIGLGQRIKQAGLLFMLDFHYSDTWADPSAQWTPADWLSLSDTQLQAKIHDYTSNCLRQLNTAGATPDFIQTGNEISYGMLRGVKGTTQNRCYTNASAATWQRFFTLLSQAVKACREECPRAKIIIHSERTPSATTLTDYFDRMAAANIDYDIIGLSYYPYFHGNLDVLENALKALIGKGYGKPIQVVEAGYPSKWAVEGTTFDYTATYPLTNEGQRRFTAALIQTLRRYPQVTGLSWWYPEANANGCTGDLKTGWYNASLWNNENGRALDALYELKNFK